MNHPDTSVRFLFEEADIRGNFVRLQGSLNDITRIHDYPAAVNEQLGEFLVAALLLSNTIKFEGRLTLQITGTGPISVLMAEATNDGKTRGIARLKEGVEPAGDFKSLFAGGTLAVTVEPTVGQRYQSLVPLQGENLAECLEHYFQQSEQLGTQIHLAAEPESGEAAGLLLQQLPAQLVNDKKRRLDQWETVSVLADTLTRPELLSKDNPTILRQLFAEDRIKLYEPSAVQFHCSCSEQRMAGALVSLGAQELADLFAETATLELSCEFCGTSYEFDTDSLTHWLQGDEPLH